MRNRSIRRYWHVGNLRFSLVFSLACLGLRAALAATSFHNKNRQPGFALKSPSDSAGLEETSLPRHGRARTVLFRLICVNDGVGRAEYHHGICQREQAMPPSDDHQVPIEPTPGDEPTPDKDPTPDDAPVPDHNPVGKVQPAKN